MLAEPAVVPNIQYPSSNVAKVVGYSDVTLSIFRLLLL